MTDNLDDRLREALRAEDPGEEFVQQVMARLPKSGRMTQQWRRIAASNRTLRWVSVSLAVSLLVAVFGVYRQEERSREQGLKARQELIEALRLTSSKLDQVYRAVQAPHDAGAEAGHGADTGA